MKNSTEHSITRHLKMRVPMFIALIILAVAITLNITVKEPALEPDEVFPMSNANVTWLQSYHAGAWSGE